MTITANVRGVCLMAMLLGGGCATTGDGSVASVEQAAVSDAEQIGIAELASKIGVNQSIVSGGFSTAKSLYNSGGHTPQSKETAVRQGASKVIANAKAQGKTLTGDESNLLNDGLRDLLK